MAIPQEEKMTADQFYEKVRDTDEMCELIDGTIVALASPSIFHQIISQRINY